MGDEDAFVSVRLGELSVPGWTDSSSDVAARARAGGSLVATSDRHGLAIAAKDACLHVWRVADVEQRAHEARRACEAIEKANRERGEARAVRPEELGVAPLAPAATVELGAALGGAASGVALSADEAQLAVVGECALVLFSVHAILTAGGGAPSNVHQLPAAGPGCAVCWCNGSGDADRDLVAVLSPATGLLTVLVGATGEVRAEVGGAAAAHWHPQLARLAVGQADTGAITMWSFDAGAPPAEVGRAAVARRPLRLSP